MNFVFFPFSEKEENVLDMMKGLMGQCPPPQNFWARTAPAENDSTSTMHYAKKQPGMTETRHGRWKIGVK